MQQPPIILLKEGTDTSQGKAQLISNINACQAIMESVRTTLGPRGMDKLVVDGRGMGIVKAVVVLSLSLSLALAIYITNLTNMVMSVKPSRAHGTRF